MLADSTEYVLARLFGPGTWWAKPSGMQPWWKGQTRERGAVCSLKAHSRVRMAAVWVEMCAQHSTTERREQGHSGGWSSFFWLLMEAMAGRKWEVWPPGVGGSAGWPEPAYSEIRSKGGRLSVWARSARSPRSLRGDSHDVDLKQRCS